MKEDGLLVGPNGIWKSFKEMERDPAAAKMTQWGAEAIEAEDRAIAEECARLRADLTKRGNTKSGEMRMMGIMPPHVYNEYPHLFGPDVPPDVRKKNMRFFFQLNPEFRVGVM
jgi:hypothetical protein